MPTYALTVLRTDRYSNIIYIEGDSPEDAKARFQHQLESKQCSQIEDELSWGESHYYQITKSSPYEREYEVLDAELEE